MCPDSEEPRLAGAGERSSEDSASETASDAVVKTTECPNCGRTFVGNYCPDCGQESEPSTSVTDVVGGFFRELVDIERGVWPTFVGLTLRPGLTLRKYLKGVRKGLARPGRYLIGALVVAFGTDQVLRWLIDSPGPSSSGFVGPPGQWNWDWAEQGLGGASAVVNYWVEQATGGSLVAVYLLMSLVLAFILHRLFHEEIGSGGEALGLSSFLVGQMALFHAGIAAVHDLFAHDLLSPLFNVLYAIAHRQEPGLSVGFGVYWLVCAVYLGIALYQCFGARWQSYAAGLGVWFWTYMEATLIYTLCTIAAAICLMVASPEIYGGFPEFYVETGQIAVEVSDTRTKAAPTFYGVAFLLLAHGALEVYYRW